MDRYFSAFLILVVSILIYSCVPVQEEVITDVELDNTDKILQKIYDFQDKGMVDSLYVYFGHADPTYRYSSAMAFASIQDSNALSKIYPLLKDNNQDVRTAAAYAIGQIGHPSGETLLFNNFERSDSLKQWQESNSAILEAVGKCGTEKALDHLSKIATYDLNDTLLLLGQARGLYRFGLRNMTNALGTQRMIDFVDNPKIPQSVMLYAANYLSRAKYSPLSEKKMQALIRRVNNSESSALRSALVIALGKTKSAPAMQELMDLYEREKNELVKCNIVRALKNFPYAQVQSIVFKALRSKQLQLSQTAAEFFLSNGQGTDGSVYLRMSRDSLDTMVKGTMLRAANKHISPIYEAVNTQVNNELRYIYRDTTRNIYERADAMKALGEYGWNYRFIFNNGFNHKEPVLRTATMEALGTIASNKNFDRNFGLGKKQVKKELSQYFASAINGNDPAMKAVAAGILADTTLNFKAEYENSSFLYVAKRKLKLPEESETLYALEDAIAAFDGTSIESKKPEYNHPIDMELFNSLPETPQARIETKKGDIIVDLYPYDAPGSVVNFIKLAKDGYFDGKTYHRVVPNFVIQAGCSRGDGYGGLDYSIRSELGKKYYDDAGYIGMASAGLHTEGTQWFITHAPTPHLDGRYTIFGKVSQGLEVAQNIEVGDIIVTVKILN